ncbi:lipopolysaccharide biosynthesis protein, partial [Verrucomicrobiales bacterium]|nr:lipopolysaccharide biosynthesis protein [Verrucomicrobiales bacterium]
SAKAAAVSGLALTVFSQALSFILTLGIGATLARLLKPEDFGLYAMAGSVIGFAHLFKDFGLSSAVVQRETITHELVSTLFWINIGLCAVLTLVVVAMAPVVAWIFDEPRLFGVTLMSSGAFLFTGLGLQHRALLQRNLRFATLMKVGIVAQILVAALSILLAFRGFGYWTLAIGAVVQPLVLALLYFVATGWIPCWPRRNTGSRASAVFGANLTGFEMINYFARNLDNFIIGRFLGSVALGFYSKAYGLLLMPLRQVNGPFMSALFPVLSRMKSDPAQYQRYYYRAATVLLAVTWPVTAFMLVEAKDIVRVMLGLQWMDSVPVFRALGIAAMVGCTNFITAWAYRSLGHVRQQLIAVSFQTPVIIASFFIGLPWGIVGVAWAYSICMLCIRIPYVGYCFRGTPLSLSAMWKAVQWPLVMSLLAGLIGWGVSLLFSAWVFWLRLPTVGVVFVVAYVTLWITFQRGRTLIQHTWSALSELEQVATLLKRSPWNRLHHWITSPRFA